MSGYSGDLFNDPFFKQLKEDMDPAEVKRYEEMGEHMYSVNVVDPEKDMIVESVAYIKEALKSGLHYTLLEDNEKELMQSYYGEKWFEEFEEKDDEVNE